MNEDFTKLKTGDGQYLQEVPARKSGFLPRKPLVLPANQLLAADRLLWFFKKRRKGNEKTPPLQCVEE
jgi:hypothetical protein